MNSPIQNLHQVETMPLQVAYVQTNPAMPGFVKIGKTLLEDVGKRLAQLYTVSHAKLARIERLLNNHPHKCSEYKIPHEIFSNSLNRVTLRT